MLTLALHGHSAYIHRDIRYLLRLCKLIITSTLITCIIEPQPPVHQPRTILPALFAGLLWATGQLGWFVANDHLSQAVSYPINGTMPCVLAALWGVFYVENEPKL